LAAIDTVAPVEREVRDRNGHWYSLRIRPYKGVDNKIDGAVLTLFDVDVPKKSAQRVRLAQEFTEALMNVIDQPLLVLDAGLRVQAANERFAPTLGVTSNAIVGQRLLDLDGTWNLDRVHERLLRFVGPRSSFERLELELDGSGAGQRTSGCLAAGCHGMNRPRQTCCCSPSRCRTRWHPRANRRHRHGFLEKRPP